MNNDSHDPFGAAHPPTGSFAPVQVGNHRLEGMATDLFVQVPTTLIEPTRTVIAAEGVGVVYTVPSQSRPRRSVVARAAVHQTRQVCPDAAILVDAGLYSGKSRKPASTPPSQDWVTVQRSAGLEWALTDSGYLAAGDTAGLRRTLKAASAFGTKVIAALPIANKWLSHDADVLREAIDKFGIPVALMVEDTYDPFDRPHVVAGLVNVLSARTPVLLLRSDTAGLGALAYGAAGAALGSSSVYRHIFPAMNGGRNPSVSFVLPELLAYASMGVFERHFIKDEMHAAWRCDCTHCGGRDLTWLRTAADPEAAALSHSVAAVAMLGRGLTDAIAHHTGPQAWTAMCTAAQLHNIEIEKLTDGKWSRKHALDAWVQITPEPVPA
ncbi:hypothetical protein [Gordonia jacobaea]|uniref:hypothetical protein n=1 Tax=Gordonia jacobaea TaxID=122202 RepID=UPI0022E62A77|nr:hypothetical protein [Gordonia jacobaea]